MSKRGRRIAAPTVAVCIAAVGLGGTVGVRGEAVDLPAPVVADVRRSFAVEGMDLRYVAGRTDLNGDGKPEIVVHVIGGGACGTGGCPTVVYTPDGTGYRRVSTTTVSNTPIRVSSESTRGWKSLIVGIGGGGGRRGNVLLAFDGKGYPGNPTTRGTPVSSLAGTTMLIPEVKTLEDSKLLPAAGRGGDRIPVPPRR